MNSDNIEQQEVAPQPFQFTLRQLLLFVAGVSLLCGLCVPPIKSARESARQASCIGLRLQMIAMALYNYHDKYGCLPPAYVADKEGKPMHSWRVLLLPFMEEHQLYDRYDFSEPWNGPKNSLLAKEIPGVYRCPSTRGGNPLATNYVAVIGPDTAWPGRRSVRLSDIAYGTTNTILLVEVADSDINWMEPRDMSFDQAIIGVNVDRKSGISSDHPGRAGCVMADGGYRSLNNGTSTETLRALLTIAGDERVEMDQDGTFSVRPPQQP